MEPRILKQSCLIKIFIILFFYSFITTKVHSQNSFSDQLKKVIAASDNNFISIRGSILSITKTDTSFSSLITIDGTSNNEIETGHWKRDDTTLYGKETSVFFALVDSVELKKGMAIVNKWKRKLSSVLDTSYKEKEIKSSWQGVGELKGVSFNNENIVVAVAQSSLERSEYCLIRLSISIK